MNTDIDPRTLNPVNLAILADRIKALDEIKGPRVGDFLEFDIPDPRCPRNYSRFTHDHGDELQTGGSMYGSYYIYAGGGTSYSGGLDSGLPKSDLIATTETREGSVWFFDEGSTGAGRGVTFMVPFRVFRLREGANTDGLGELRCPYYLDQPRTIQHRYWYLVSKSCMSHVAFENRDGLMAWLSENRLVLTRPLTPEGEVSCQFLGWPA